MKHLHMLLAAMSVALFTFRFALLMTNPETLKKKWLKITPHVIDTLLFTVGIIMIVKLSLYPGQVDWMSEKLLAVVAYIFTGFYTLKFARNKTMRLIGFFGAIGWVCLIAHIAMSKQTFLLS